MKTRLVLDAVEGKQIMPAILGVCDGTLRANCENKTTTKIEAGSMAHRANVLARPSPAHVYYFQVRNPVLLSPSPPPPSSPPPQPHVRYECLLAHVGRATWRDNGIPSAGEDDSHPTAAASVPSVVRASMPNFGESIRKRLPTDHCRGLRHGSSNVDTKTRPDSAPTPPPPPPPPTSPPPTPPPTP
ncbi:hypothetical protein C0Q70_09130 [Pomacea canaliculata]|uniref:Uncharacterized protein n=1 Tax=Pomacea canaliculata TaxID=400727 RepID=A0A2T7P8X8_POMCA|nr:hypothetical protein C0Q70_09130 [Pomacea canaliculata]